MNEQQKIISYPNLSPIASLYPNSHILLGKKIYWEEKRDGSNIGAYLNENDELTFRSRHREIADVKFEEAVLGTEYAEKLLEYLTDSRHTWGSENIIFFELLLKGKSPTKMEFHEETEIAVFDIHTSKSGWLNYEGVYQKCYQYKLPVVEVYGISTHTTLESLLAFRDDMLAICKEKKREGVVGKVWHGYSEKPIMFKEKLDMPDFRNVRKQCDEGEIELPELPESEIMGAIEKARIDLGDAFSDIRQAMPLVAQYVNEETVKHNCSQVKNPFAYYKQRLEDISR